MRFGLLLVLLSEIASAAPSNPFFAMDTATKGTADSIVPIVAYLGFAGMSAHIGNFETLTPALKEKGLNLYATYYTTALDADKPALEAQPTLRDLIDRLGNTSTTLWLGITKITRDGTTLQPSQVPDPLVAARLHEIVSYAAEHKVPVSLYPHAGFFVEHVEHALLLTRLTALPNLTITFNLCHWLKVEGDRDPTPVLKEALPHLGFVTLNGANRGDTKTLSWNELIQTIGSGSYDLSAFTQVLQTIGYTGPIGLQHYGIPGDWKENLTLSMTGWKALP